MKTRLWVVIGGLATFLALSALGLSGDLAGNVGALEQLSELSTKFATAVDEKDPVALAALFTRDAVCVTSEGVFSGREAIEEELRSDFERSATTSHIFQTDQLHSVGNEAWSIGQWWKTLRGSSGPVFVSGYWSAIIVHDGDVWKFRMLTFSEGPRRDSPPQS
jgi:ketosteroid isomerase-like protein